MTVNLSIIVPVYNAERTLERCVSSILAQVYTDFELILINDGSTDRSGPLCDQLAASDARIRVIHQANSGASAARNRGLQEARGQYLMFCDSDDAVSPHWISRLIRYADRDTFPMGSYCHQPALLGTEKPLSVPSGESLPATLYYLYKESGVAGFLCNALFVTGIVKEHGLRFRERRAQGDYNEDLLFTLEYVRHIRNLVYTGYADYLYGTHEGSLSRSYCQLYFPKYQEKFLLWKQFLTESGNDGDSLDRLAQETMFYFLTALNQHLRSGSYRQFRQIIRSDAMADCLKLSVFPRENPRVIALLQQQAAFRLWLLLTISNLKGR